MINEYLLGERPLIYIVKNSYRDCVKPLLLQPVEQMGTADSAETTLRPFRGVENGDVLLTIEADAAITLHREKGAAAPLQAHCTVARFGVGGVGLGCDFHCATKTGAAVFYS